MAFILLRIRPRELYLEQLIDKRGTQWQNNYNRLSKVRQRIGYDKKVDISYRVWRGTVRWMDKQRQEQTTNVYDDDDLDDDDDKRR